MRRLGLARPPHEWLNTREHFTPFVPASAGTNGEVCKAHHTYWNDSLHFGQTLRTARIVADMTGRAGIGTDRCSAHFKKISFQTFSHLSRSALAVVGSIITNLVVSITVLTFLPVGTRPMALSRLMPSGDRI